MDKVLREEVVSCYVYVDDIRIFEENEIDAKKALNRVLKLLIAAGIIANKDKMEIRKRII